MVQKLVPGVWLLELGLVEPLDSNAYLIADEGTVTLVDTGLFLNRPSMAAELEAAGFGIADIDCVLLTHYDIDHVGGLAALDGFDGPIYLGAADASLVDGTSKPSWAHHKGAFHRAVRMVWNLDGRDVLPVEDGDCVGGFTAYHTPGHNPGHTVYLHERLGVAFLGDLVWEEDGQLTTPIRFDSYDMDELRRSVRALADRIPPFEVAAMGHGDPILTGGASALAALAARC